MRWDPCFCVCDDVMHLQVFEKKACLSLPAFNSSGESHSLGTAFDKSKFKSIFGSFLILFLFGGGAHANASHKLAHAWKHTLVRARMSLVVGVPSEGICYSVSGS